MRSGERQCWHHATPASVPRGVRQAHPTRSAAQQQQRRGACALWAVVCGPAGPCSPPPMILA
eukprot:7918711-Alexandrium_andersonii.AAC.1